MLNGMLRKLLQSSLNNIKSIMEPNHLFHLIKEIILHKRLQKDKPE